MEAARVPRRPALVANGTHDTTRPLSMAEELAGFLGAAVTSLPGIGHCRWSSDFLRESPTCSSSCTTALQPS
ncbi:hypothetical protein HBB16_12415 [Pseudonocardia sp. MCCB 268]|nr:hypothetical protein [Pseudonocardia cytotoxica]